MKDRIGEIAEKIWTILEEKQNVDILTLPTILKESKEIVYQALGWLAREDKIKYRKSGIWRHLQASQGWQRYFYQSTKNLRRVGKNERR
jgi:hypothetical protein